MGRRSKRSDERRKEIGARLRYIRENKGMSLKAVVKRLDPPPVWQTLAKWELGEIEIPIDRIEELAKIYAINPAEMLGWFSGGGELRKRRKRRARPVTKDDIGEPSGGAL